MLQTKDSKQNLTITSFKFKGQAEKSFKIFDFYEILIKLINNENNIQHNNCSLEMKNITQKLKKM